MLNNLSQIWQQNAQVRNNAKQIGGGLMDMVNSANSNNRQQGALNTNPLIAQVYQDVIDKMQVKPAGMYVSTPQ